MSINTDSIANSPELISPEVKPVAQPYYSIIKDLKGKCLLFNFSGEVSDSPFDGFSSPISDDLKNIINEILLNSDEPVNVLNEYSRSFETDGHLSYYLITQFNSFLNGEEVRNFLIRPADNLSRMFEECNKQLAEERNVNKINTKCISSVSHDFRTPLSIIYANLQLLEYHEFQLDPETIEEAFSLSRMAVKSLLRVLDKVTVIDSMNKGRLENKPAKFDLKVLCTNLVKELNDTEVIPDRIKYVHDESVNEVEIDEYLFRSLFTHLIFNALAYSKKDYKVLFESKVLSENIIRFKVKDSGIGFTQEHIDALNVFFSGSDLRLIEGVGLGLAIVKECLLLQKGNLSISSIPGKGSEFIIDLPMKLIS